MAQAPHSVALAHLIGHWTICGRSGRVTRPRSTSRAGRVRRGHASLSAAPRRLAHPLKAMVPVNLRPARTASDLGNGISFMFLGLPCDEADAVQRLRTVNKITTERKRVGEPRGADTVFKLVARAPHFVQNATARLAASPRTFSLVISNIPGPPNGCTCVAARSRGLPGRAAGRAPRGLDRGDLGRGGACFGLYADRKAMPDVELLARDVDGAIDELLVLGANGHRPTVPLAVPTPQGGPARWPDRTQGATL